MLIILHAGPAAADPAGPTNYQTSVEEVVPPTGAFDISIVGGDSFLLLEQREPVTISVNGYNREPYLRFLPDGTVERNRRSPATYLNTDRYGDIGSSNLPDDASADADPEWEVVADDGVYAWHDHRAHWMLANPPLGLGPGDQILDDTIPVEVDGSPIDVRVVSFWQPAPSPLPAIIALVVAVGIGVGAWRSRRFLWLALLVGALPALVAGYTEYSSLPAATEPSPVPWILPLIALMAAIAAFIARSKPATSLPLLMGGAAALVVFAVSRLDSLSKAILPTSLPFWFERSATAGALGLGAAIVVTGAVELRRILRPPPAA